MKGLKNEKIKTIMKIVRINIDLPEDVAKQWNVIAAMAGKDRKNHIQDLLTDLAKKKSKVYEKG